MESKTSTLPACEELINVGITNILEDVVERIMRLGMNGDIAAGVVAKFFQNQCGGSENPITLEYRQMIFRAVDEDPEFISEFSTRTRKIIIDFFSRKAHEASVEELIKKFDNV